MIRIVCSSRKINIHTIFCHLAPPLAMDFRSVYKELHADRENAVATGTGKGT